VAASGTSSYSRASSGRADGGKLPGGLRSEFMGDFIFSDFAVQEGYAYASTNKGTLNFFFTEPVTDALACRLSPPTAATSATFVHFYIAEPKDTITEWFRRTREVTDLARRSRRTRSARPNGRISWRCQAALLKQ
jgi:hypothetical protein